MKFEELITQQAPVLLDGAMGTELQRKGYKTTLPLWTAMANLEVPELVTQIHQEYIEAGSQIITTNTFRTTGYTFEKSENRELALNALNAAVDCAKKAVRESKKAVLVAGSVTTLEDCYEPESVPDVSILEKEHKEQIKRIVDTGVDLLLLETFNSLKEVEVVIKASSVYDIPLLLSVLLDENANLLCGNSLLSLLDFLKPYAINGVLLNCRAPELMGSNLAMLIDNFEGITGVYANGIGEPHEDLGWIFSGQGDPSESYRNHAKKWLEQGVKIIGGCCGTTPEYIAKLNKLVTSTTLN